MHQSDAAGNPGPWARLPFRAGAPAPTASAASGARPAGWRRNPRRLRPAAGAVVRTVRPLLRWTAGPRGTSLYNVQVFEVAGPRLRQVRSEFPTGTRLRLTARRALRDGRCYAWRVWPYRGDGYTRQPIAVSDFCVRSGRGAVR